MSFLSVLSLTVTLIVLIEISNGAEEKSCKQIVADLTKRQMAGIATCTKSMTFKNGKDKAAKMMCVLKCVMIKEGLLDAGGMLTMEQVNKLIEKEVPPSLMVTVRPLFENCVSKTAGGLDPNEEFCKTYDPLIKCLMAGLGTICPK